MPEVTDLHAEYLPGPVTVVPSATPRLSWRTRSEHPGWTQASAEIRLRRGDLDDVRPLAGRASVLVDWPFPALVAGEPVTVDVRVTGADGATSAWSEPLTLEAAAVPRRAALIAHPSSTGPTPVRFVHDLTIREGLIAARLRITAHGAYQARINGTPVGDEVLAPGWTSYRDRLLVQTHDVTALLRPGPARLAVTVAAGWFGERYGFMGQATRAYDGPPALLAALELRFADGAEEIATGGDWLATTAGPVTASGIYAGEHHDARRDVAGWSRPGTALPDLRPVVVRPFDATVLAPVEAPPVRRTGTLAPVASFRTPAGCRVLDFGQNIAGRVRLTVRGPAGTTVTLRHAEVLEDGELALRPLRLAAATDSYTLAGSGDEIWEPEFTFHGFRYVQVDGWPGDADPGAAVVAVVIGSDLRPTGTWTSSHELLNRLHRNVVWSMRGNFLSVPSDCPQRDERLGWTGDLQLFAPAAAFLADVRGFLASWLADLALEQRRAGGITPLVVPSVLPPVPDPIAGWGDAATVVPWTLYQRYGDVGILRRQYASMRAWVEAVLERTDGQVRWLRGGQIGDHLDPTAPPDRPTQARTAPEIVACAYLVRSLRIVAQTAELLERADDAERFAELAGRARAAFVDLFVTPGGRMVSDAPTAYALALCFDLVQEPGRRRLLGERLAELVRENGYRIGTGFIGTPLLLDALLATGQLDPAARLLTRTRAPSWLYPVTMGATTVWERWDSLLPDGRVNPGEMTSFNHYALGSVADTLHRRVAGLAPAAPGYARLRCEPQPLPGLTAAAASLDTPYGKADVGWAVDGDRLRVTVVVPPNTSADVRLPGWPRAVTVGAGRHEFGGVVPPGPDGPGAVDLDTDLSVLVDDDEALAAVAGALDGHGDGRGAAFLDDTRFAAGARLADVLMFAAPAVRDDVRRALEAVTATRR